NFSWVQSGASWIIIRMDIRIPNQTESLDSVHCISYDTGSFTVDSSKWNPSIPWSSNYQVDILFTRVTETVVTLPHDNSSGRMIGQYTLYGAGIPN
ncbi:MAG: hypothetical protein VX278_03960, partial [Myxococcota bacterium]|nr:hypothetical protein [Myxococcota bacterium]